MPDQAPPGAPRARRRAKPRASLEGLALLAYDPESGTIVQVAPDALREVLAAVPPPEPAPVAPDPSDDVPLHSDAGLGLVTDGGQRLVGDVR